MLLDFLSEGEFEGCVPSDGLGFLQGASVPLWSKRPTSGQIHLWKDDAAQLFSDAENTGGWQDGSTS